MLARTHHISADADLMRTKPSTTTISLRVALLAAAAGAALSACSPEPRTYEYFLADKIARDGVLARCDADPVAARADIECAQARRAALAVQLEEERARRAALERESEARIEALRRQYEAERQAREAAAAAAAAAAERALYPDEFFEIVPVDEAAADPSADAGSPGERAPAAPVDTEHVDPVSIPSP